MLEIAADRFWSKVEIGHPAGCWEWIAGKFKNGYGGIGIGHSKVLYAHRVAYELLVGEIPEDMTIDHLCRNRTCVNPDHLEPVTRAENTMRGYGFAPANSAKTHCPRNHPYDSVNTHINKRGHRICRACARERMRRKARAASD